MNQSALVILLLTIPFFLITIINTSTTDQKEWNLLILIEQKYNIGLSSTDTDFFLNLTAKEHAFRFPAQTIFPKLMIANDAFFFIKLLPTSTAFTILTIRDPLNSVKLNIRAYEKRDQANQFRLSIFYNTVLFGEDEYKNETEITIPFLHNLWTLGILFENKKITVYTNCEDVSSPFGYHHSSDTALINKKFFDSGATLFLLNNGEINGNKERFEGIVSEFILTNKKNIEDFMCQKEEMPEGSGIQKKTWKPKNIGNYLITESTTESSSTIFTSDKHTKSNESFANKSLGSSTTSRSIKQVPFTKKSLQTEQSTTTIGTIKSPIKNSSSKMFLSSISKTTVSTKFTPDFPTYSEKPLILRRMTTTAAKRQKFLSGNSTNTSQRLSTLTRKPTVTTERFSTTTTSKLSTIRTKKSTIKKLTTTAKEPTIITKKSTNTLKSLFEKSSTTTKSEKSTILTKKPIDIIRKLAITTEKPTTNTKKFPITTKHSTVKKLITQAKSYAITEKPKTITNEQQKITLTEKPKVALTAFQPKFLTATEYFNTGSSIVTPTRIKTSTDQTITTKEPPKTLSKSNNLKKIPSKCNNTMSKREKNENEIPEVNSSVCECQRNLRLNIPEKGTKGTQGLKGQKGEKGNEGAPGINGVCLASQCKSLPPIKGSRGDKGETGYCSLESCKINKIIPKGEKGNKGERGFKGNNGDGLKISEIIQILLPEVKSTIDDFVSRNIMNMKGEPGSCSCPPEAIKEEEKIKTQTLILNDAKSLKSLSLTMPVGQMAFIIVENTLLIKIDDVKNRWRVVKLENSETDWYFASDTQNSQFLMPNAGQPMFNTAFKLMLIALPKPTGGDLRSDPFEPGAYSGSSYLCQKQAYNYGLGRAFYPLLNTDMFDFNYLLPEKYRYGVPIVNRRNEKIALSYADLLKPSVEMQANILDFRGDSIISETNEPCVWIGEKPSLHEDKNPTEEGLCLNWMSQSSKNSAKVAILKLNKPLLNSNQIKSKSCNTMCYILCMQIYPLMSEVHKR